MTDIVLNAPDSKLLVCYVMANIKQYLYTLEFHGVVCTKMLSLLTYLKRLTSLMSNIRKSKEKPKGF